MTRWLRRFRRHRRVYHVFSWRHGTITVPVPDDVEMTREWLEAEVVEIEKALTRWH